MAYKRKTKPKAPEKKTYVVIQGIKADIADHIIIAAIGAEIELTANEADVLKHHIKEKE